MPLFKCPYLNDNLCMIASAKSHIECFPTPEECKACSQDTPSRDENSVTNAIIKRTFDQYHTPMPPHLQSLGPGTKLKLLVSKWSNADDDCGCNNKIQIIDSWGSNYINHLDSIEEMLMDGAKDSSNLFIRLVAKYIPFLPRMIIRRTIRIITRNHTK